MKLNYNPTPKITVNISTEIHFQGVWLFGVTQSSSQEERKIKAYPQVITATSQLSKAVILVVVTKSGTPSLKTLEKKCNKLDDHKAFKKLQYIP